MPDPNVYACELKGSELECELLCRGMRPEELLGDGMCTSSRVWPSRSKKEYPPYAFMAGTELDGPIVGCR